MKISKYKGGISGRCFCMAQSAKRVRIQTLDMSLINQLSTKKACRIIHCDLANTLIDWLIRQILFEGIVG